MRRKNDILRQLKKKRRMSRSTFWMEAGTRAVTYLCAVVLACIVLSVALPGSVEQINCACLWASAALALLWAIPFIRFTQMRLRDIGYGYKIYFWLLLPVAGWLVFAGLMCKKGTSQNAASAVEIL